MTKEVKKDEDGFQQVKKKNRGFNVGPPKKPMLECRPKIQQKKNDNKVGTNQNTFEILNSMDVLNEKSKDSTGVTDVD